MLRPRGAGRQLATALHMARGRRRVAFSRGAVSRSDSERSRTHESRGRRPPPHQSRGLAIAGARS
jgi:hypothetical protein